jgi:hypothetical protein
MLDGTGVLTEAEVAEAEDAEVTRPEASVA